MNPLNPPTQPLLRRHTRQTIKSRSAALQHFHLSSCHFLSQSFSLSLGLFNSHKKANKHHGRRSARLTHEFISGFAGRRAPVLIWLSAHIHGKQQHPESHPKRNSQSTRGRTEPANLSRPQFVGGWYGNWEGGLYLIPAVAERIKWTISTKFPWQTELDVETRRLPKFAVRKSFPVEWTSLQMGKWGNQFISPLIRWMELL